MISSSTESYAPTPDKLPLYKTANLLKKSNVFQLFNLFCAIEACVGHSISSWQSTLQPPFFPISFYFSPTVLYLALGNRPSPRIVGSSLWHNTQWSCRPFSMFIYPLPFPLFERHVHGYVGIQMRISSFISALGQNAPSMRFEYQLLSHNSGVHLAAQREYWRGIAWTWRWCFHPGRKREVKNRVHDCLNWHFCTSELIAVESLQAVSSFWGSNKRFYHHFVHFRWWTIWNTKSIRGHHCKMKPSVMVWSAMY